jgi:hypothetical protein
VYDADLWTSSFLKLWLEQELFILDHIQFLTGNQPFKSEPVPLHTYGKIAAWNQPTRPFSTPRLAPS